MERLQPLVLVGGASLRFGRDKLREPVGSGWLVDRPIAALRAVFGPCVAAVGECHESVAARADLVLPDRLPGIGPLGGIVSALEASDGGVFVLAGDLPAMTETTVRQVLDAAAAAPDAPAVLAQTSGVEPCIGIYRQAALPELRRAAADGRHAMHDAIRPLRCVLVAIPPGQALNANSPDELRRSLPQQAS